LLELLLGESGLHFQLERRSTPRPFPSFGGRVCFQCPSADARVPAIARLGLKEPTAGGVRFRRPRAQRALSPKLPSLSLLLIISLTKAVDLA
jgi:hypothetical protein